MRIQYSLLAHKKVLEIEETIRYSKEETQNIYTLLDMKDVQVKAKATYEGDFVHLDLDIQTDLVLECAYTLEAVDYPMHLQEAVELCFQRTTEEEQEDVIYVDGDYYDLHDLILSFIITEIPLKVVKKGASLPKDGDGYEVISEDEYYRRQQEQTDPRFACLDDLDVDE